MTREEIKNQYVARLAKFEKTLQKIQSEKAKAVIREEVETLRKAIAKSAGGASKEQSEGGRTRRS
jgi:hypothetical protein